MPILSFDAVTKGLPAEKRVELEVAVFDTDKELVQTLYGSQKGKVFAVLGGGVALLDDVAKLPKTCKKIGVNQHAVACGVDVDYLVLLDDGIAAKCREFSGAPIISTLADDALVSYLIACDENESLCAGFQSAIPAMMLAVKMGAKKVILCGFDLYTSGEKYCTGDTALKQPDLSLMMDFWRQAAQKLGDDAKKISVSAASPLADIFDTFE